jgi:phosphoribosyl-ATP pyrophosphohydrolase
MSDMLDKLEAIIQDRKASPKEGSYTNSLLDRGLPKISQKVGEEAVEVVVAALAQDREAQLGDLADLMYHTLVLMAALDISLDELGTVLAARHQPD